MSHDRLIDFENGVSTSLTPKIECYLDLEIHRIKHTMKTKSNSAKVVFLGARTFLMPKRISFLEADINYTKVHSINGNYQLLSTTIKDVMKCLEGQGDFVRISRKHAVNIAHVKETKETGLLLKNGTFLKPSRRKRKELHTLFIDNLVQKTG